MNLLKKGRMPIMLLTILCILLGLALLSSIVLFQQYKDNIAVSANAQTQPEEDLPKEDVVTIASLKEYAQKDNVSIEFLQRFFDDVIVYKDVDGIVYAPIDENLPKHSYDFNNLVQVDGEVQYTENGVSKGIKGIDVSKHQGNINWKKVKADNVEFAIIRLGYRGYETGQIVIDEYFKQNIKGALDAGIKVGVYFFSQAITVEEATEEADTVLKYIKDYKIAYPVIFDAEEMLDDVVRTKTLTTKERTDITLAFCDKVKNAGYQTMIYANIKWFVAQLDMTRLTQYDKWFAQYFKAPFFPYEFQMWQYTAKGKVDGITGDVDLNICFKNYASNGS